MIRLQRVLPNIFKAFPMCNPYDVLVECNLCPTSGNDGVCTFFFRPEREGADMVQPRKRDPAHAEPSSNQEETRVVLFRKGPASDEQMESYSELTTSWRS